MTLDHSAVPVVPEAPAFTVDQLTPQDCAAVSAFLAARLRELTDSGQAAASAAWRQLHRGAHHQLRLVRSVMSGAR
ncbi:hypothetical protein ACLF6K_04845 [Streptomyces xanthophaeus]|uniref:hypothetical protein n=1 Tax=Streptomyces xanthophaeus TaxID=67385 RepID=UPI00398FB0E6